MQKKILFSAVSAIGLLASMSASAHDDGWYLRGNAGYGIHHGAEITGGMLSEVHGNGLQSEGNAAYSAGVGYDFGDHWRVEVDADVLDTTFGSISQIPSSKASLATQTLMLNALYDFGDFDRWEPYVGAGIGLVDGKVRAAAHDFDGGGGILNANPACPGGRSGNDSFSCAISDSDRGFGWQLLAGLGYDISDNLTWDTHYTYLNGPNLNVTGHRANQDTGAFDLFDAQISDVGAHTLMTGLRYKFGHDHAPKVVERVAPQPTFECWDGNMVFNSGQCAARPVVEAAPEPAPTFSCWDGSIVYDTATCPAEPQPVVEQAPTYACWDGTVTYDLATCPAEPVVVQQTTNFNVCGSSPVAIFDVPVNTTPKQMPRLGTLPEFGDSHGLSPSQFYDKLNSRYSSNATDKAYLNYLFKSMGYSNGWADAQPYMFSEEILPVGTTGLLGLGEQHHFNYSVLPTNQRDREAFRIQSANGVVVHFMKTCGNYMYACE